MKTVIAAMVVLSAVLVVADDKPAAEESVRVSVVGTLRTGVVAIGSETTGTTITARKITWELEFAKNSDLQKLAETLDGKRVAVEGTLERRAGVEVKDRWIVIVSKLKPGMQPGK